MANLTECVRQAGKALNARDLDEIKDLRDSLKGDGLTAQEAAIQAVVMRIDELREERGALADELGSRAQSEYLDQLTNYNKHRSVPAKGKAPEHSNTKAGKSLVKSETYPMPEKMTDAKEPNSALPFIEPDVYAEIIGVYEWLFPDPKKSNGRVSFDTDAELGRPEMKDGRYAGPGSGIYVTDRDAKKKIAKWKADAADQHPGKNKPLRFPGRGSNADKVVLSLFDMTGEWSQPYRDAGYDVYMFDIQDGQDITEFTAEYFNDTFNFGDVFAILAACPCTDFANSGSRHWAAKDEDGRTEASKELVFQTLRTIEYFRPQIWALENPTGRIEKLTGLPPWRLGFQPHNFGADYTKKTLLWGNFNPRLETANRPPTKGSKMWIEHGGSSLETKNARSETPEGFAYSFFNTNNVQAMDSRTFLVSKYTNVTSAIDMALDAGLSEDKIHDVLRESWDFDGAEAVQALKNAVKEAKSGPDVDMFSEEKAEAQKDAAKKDAPASTSKEKKAKQQGERVTPAQRRPRDAVLRDPMGNAYIESTGLVINSLEIVPLDESGNANKKESIIVPFPKDREEGVDYFWDNEIYVDGRIVEMDESTEQYWLQKQLQNRIDMQTQLESRLASGKDNLGKIIGYRTKKTGSRIILMGEPGWSETASMTREIKAVLDRLGEQLESWGVKVARKDRPAAARALTKVRDLFIGNLPDNLKDDITLPSTPGSFPSGSYIDDKTTEYDPKKMTEQERIDYWVEAARAVSDARGRKKIGDNDWEAAIDVVASKIYTKMDPELPKAYQENMQRGLEISRAERQARIAADREKRDGPAQQSLIEEPGKNYDPDATVTQNNGDIDAVDKTIARAARAAIRRKSKAEQKRINENLDEFRGSAWAVLAIKGLAIREFFELANEGKGNTKAAQEIITNDIWGGQSPANNSVIKAFLNGTTENELNAYTILTDNAKAEKSVSTSMTNCDPSAACAAHCYDATGRGGGTWMIIKSEFLEWASEKMQDQFAYLLQLEYEASALHNAGLALRLNDKGDLSEAQVRLASKMKDNGTRMQIFSKRPELLRQVDPFHLRMLSVDSTNLDVARDNPDMQLAITLTDDMRDQDLAKIASRAAVVLPVNLKGVTWSMDAIRKKWPKSYAQFKKRICPVEVGLTGVERGSSYVQITDPNKAVRTSKGERAWTCTSCDKLGAIGCFWGDDQTVVARSNMLGSSDPLQNEKIQAVNQIRLQLTKLQQMGELTNEQRKQILEGLEGGDGPVSVTPDATAATKGRRSRSKKGGDNDPGGAVSEEVDPYGQNTDDHLGWRNEDVNNPAPPDSVREQTDMFVQTREDPRVEPISPEVRKQAFEDTFATTTKRIQTSELKTGTTEVKGTGDLAHLVAQLRKRAQERFIVVATDADDNVLLVDQHTTGLKSSSSVDPLTVIANAAGVPGAKTIHFAHNHPSGSPSPSDSDYKITKSLVDGLDGTGIEFGGHIIVGGSRNYTEIPRPDSNAFASRQHSVLPIPAMARTETVPVMERQLVRRGKIGKDVKGPVAAKRLAKDIGSPNALILMDNQNFPVGVVRMSEEEMASLRQGERVNRVYQAINTTNASSAIIKAESQAVGENMAGLLNVNNFRVLDILWGRGSELNSYAEVGINIDSITGFARVTGPEPSGLDSDQITDSLREMRRKWTNGPDITVVQSSSDLPSYIQEQMRQQGITDIGGWFDRERGTVHIVADGMQDPRDAQVTLAHEAIGHYGIEAIMGSQLGEFLREVDAARGRDEAISEAYRKVDQLYPGASPINKAAEVVAKLAESQPKHNLVQRFFQMLRRALRSLGFNVLFSNDDVTEALRRAEQFLETGGTRIAGRGGMFQSAYHGTPHKVDKFSTEKIGTGEGAQVYGWGLYFAEAKNVAEYYKKQLSGEEGTKEIYIDGKRYGHFNPTQPGPFNEAMTLIDTEGGADAAADYIRKAVRGGGDPDVWEPVMGVIQSMRGRDLDLRESGGSLYEVDVPEDEDLLNWETPISEQSDNIQNIVDGILDDIDSSSPQLLEEYLAELNTEWYELNGQELYVLLVRAGIDGALPALPEEYLRALGDDERASKYLMSKGIAGHKYYDEYSRFNAPEPMSFGGWLGVTHDKDLADVSGTEDESRYRDEYSAYIEEQRASDKRTFNFVIYDDDRIKITDTLFQSTQGDIFGDVDIEEAVDASATSGKLSDSEIGVWREAHKVSQRVGRVPEVQEAAKRLAGDLITAEEYRRVVRKHQPIMPIQDVPELTSVRDMSGALATNKAQNILGVDRDIAQGTRVATRLDIPAYDFYDTWVVTVHDGSKKGGNAIAYGSAASMENVEFVTSPKAALGIATGTKAKAPFARIHGDWQSVKPEEAREKAKRAMSDPDWVQVGMNPFRHSYFYNKSNGRPVVAAEEAVQIGPLVMARGVQYAHPESDQFNIKGTNIFFQAVNRANEEREELNRRIREEHYSVWKRASKYAKRQLLPGGNLPRDVFNAKIERDSDMESGEMQNKADVWGLERAFKRGTGRSYDKRTDREDALMAAALAGNTEVYQDLPDAVVVSLESMRQRIDGMSERYTDILREDGARLLNELEPERREELMAAIMAGDIEGLRGKEAEIAQKVSLLMTITSNIGTYVHRSYRAFDDPAWPKEVSDEIQNAARDYLESAYLEKNEDATDAEAVEAAQRVIEKILKRGTAFDSMESFIKESKLGARDLSLLKRRKDIAPEILALMGVHTDARLNFARTATKMERLIFNDNFLKKVKEVGMGVFLFEEGTQPEGAWKPLSSEGNPAMEPLDGLLTYPEIEQAFIDALGKENLEGWLRTAIQLNGMVKFGKTVLSPTTAARNWMSAMFFAFANGHFDLTETKRSIQAMSTYFSHGDPGTIARTVTGATGGEFEYLKKLKKLGVVYDTPYAGEMMRLLEDSKIADKLTAGKLTRGLGIKHALDTAQRFYQFGDDFWKIVGFENEKRAQLKYNPGMTETQAEVVAAERIRSTYPTYSMTGRLTNQIRRNPLFGTFVSFPAEIIRTSFNILKYAKQDWQHNKMLGARRIAGIAMVSGFAYALQEAFKSMLGVDDEEEEAVRQQLPPWSVNSNLMFLSREGGNLRYLDLSFLDPYNYWKRPITAIMRDDAIKDRSISAARDMLSPFFGTDIAAGALVEIWSNQKLSNKKPVYNETETAMENAMDIGAHLWKNIQPGATANATRMWKAFNDERKSDGSPYSVEDEIAANLGFRVSTLNPSSSLLYRTLDATSDLREISGVLNRQVRNPNKISDDDLRDLYDRTRKMEKETYEDLIRSVKAAKKSGLSTRDAAQRLRDGGLSRRDAIAIAGGRVPVKMKSPRYMLDMVRSAASSYDEQTAKDLQRRRMLVIKWSRERPAKASGEG